VYWARTSWLRTAHVDLLTKAEAARCERYLRAEDRSRFTVAAALLRIVVGLHTGLAPDRVIIDRTCPRCLQPHGRPRVVGHALEVSVSHSGAFAAVAATDAGRVGVDVEHVRPLDYAALLEQTCAPEERDGVTDSATFFGLWTRKESVLKATGAGLELPMSEIRVTPATQAPRLVSYAGDRSVDARMAVLSPVPDYAGAVTVLTSAPVDFNAHHAADLLASI
jgi:4'-phosphopantetheinyl transferase